MKRLTDFETLLSASLSRRVIEDIVRSVSSYPEDFQHLYDLIKLKDNEKASWRAAWACEKLCEIAPELFMDKRSEMMQLAITQKNDSKKRLLLSMLYDLPLKDVFSTNFLNTCLDWMFSPKESIGVQALSIRMAYKLCEYEPELLPELQLYLESAETEYMSTGVKTTVKNVLKKINKKKK